MKKTVAVLCILCTISVFGMIPPGAKCAISIADSYAIHRGAKWLGRPFPETRFPFFLSLLQESEVEIIRNAKNLEMPEAPFLYLKESVKGIRVISDNELQLAVGNKTLSFYRNVTESERNLVRESISRFSYNEKGFLRIRFSGGFTYESKVIFEGEQDRINFDPIMIAKCHDDVMARISPDNRIVRIELIYTHPVDPLLIHHSNGTVSPAFAYPATDDNADLEFPHYFRYWLQGRTHLWINGTPHNWDLADLKKRENKKSVPQGFIEALEKIKQWNAEDATLVITATIGTRIPSLFKYSYEESASPMP
jgi:hypothetical protein